MVRRLKDFDELVPPKVHGYELSYYTSVRADREEARKIADELRRTRGALVRIRHDRPSNSYLIYWRPYGRKRVLRKLDVE